LLHTVKLDLTTCIGIFLQQVKKVLDELTSDVNFINILQAAFFTGFF